MNRYGLLNVILVAALAVGCAKTPPTSGMSTSSPGGGSADSSRSTGTSADASGSKTAGRGDVASASRTGSSGAPGTSGSPTTARPDLSEFVATRDLTDIHFDFDKYAIRMEDGQILERNARWLKTNGKELVLVEGHADERGTNEYNLALGERRARAAVDHLVAHGVSARRITMISYGRERPQCKDQSEACWAKNRRAHFLVKRG